MNRLSDVFEHEFEIIAVRPGEVTTFCTSSLEEALTQARAYALDGWQCLVRERTEHDALEVVVTCEAA